MYTPIDPETMFRIERRAGRRVLRLFLETGDAPVAVNVEHAELVRFLRRNEDGPDRHVGARVLMLLHHAAVIHLVDVVAAQDAARTSAAPRQSSRCSGTPRRRCPGTSSALTRCIGGRISMNSPNGLAHNIPAFADVPVQRQRLVLREDVHLPQFRIDAVGQRDVDDAVDSAKRNRRLSAIARQRIKPLTRATR